MFAYNTFNGNSNHVAVQEQREPLRQSAAVVAQSNRRRFDFFSRSAYDE
jgi:hypothetical protein